MKVTEQIDAIEASAVNPYKLLALPRIVACIPCCLYCPSRRLLRPWQLVGFPDSGGAALVTQFINSGFSGAEFSDLLPPRSRPLCLA